MTVSAQRRRGRRSSSQSKRASTTTQRGIAGARVLVVGLEVGIGVAAVGHVGQHVGRVRSAAGPSIALRVGVDQQLGRVEAQSRARRVGAVDAVAVALAAGRRRAGSVPVVRGAGRSSAMRVSSSSSSNRQSSTFSACSEKSEKFVPCAVPGRAERERLPAPGDRHGVRSAAAAARGAVSGSSGVALVVAVLMRGIARASSVDCWWPGGEAAQYSVIGRAVGTVAGPPPASPPGPAARARARAPRAAAASVPRMALVVPGKLVGEQPAGVADAGAAVARLRRC